MNTERVIERIKKLLALANDLAATEGERDNALRMAYATMAKYNIDMATVDEASRDKSEPRIDFKNDGWSWTWAKQVRNIIADLFMCKYYYSGKINGTQCHHHYVGRESNAMTAAVMADYVVDSILKEGRKIYKQNTAPGTRAFAVGAMHKLYARVKEIKASQMQQTEAQSSGTALVLASLYQTEADANAAFILATIGELGEARKSRQTRVDRDAYAAGREFGGRINLSAQIAGTTSNVSQIGN